MLRLLSLWVADACARAGGGGAPAVRFLFRVCLSREQSPVTATSNVEKGECHNIMGVGNSLSRERILCTRRLGKRYM